MIEWLKKVGASKGGAAAILGLGGPAAAYAIMTEVVPAAGVEVQGAVVGMVGLLGLLAALLGPKAKAAVQAWLEARGGAK